MKFFVYIIQCADKTFYTGYTTDLDKRIEKHNRGKGAKYTRSRLPVRLIWSEEFPTKSAAMKEEYRIKQLDRKMKGRLADLSGKDQEIVKEISKVIREYRFLGPMRLANIIAKAFQTL